MKPDIGNVEQVTAAVMEKLKYRYVHADLVKMLAEDEFAKGRTPKEAIKEVAGKLHQVAGAYFMRSPDYRQWGEALDHLPDDIHHPNLQAYCVQIMRKHSSTAERIPILHEFFQTALEAITPVKSILDLACGLNPLALSWMPVTESTKYYGCDLYSDLASFMNGFYARIGRHGQFETCNLLDLDNPKKPAINAQVAFLLKSVPCLDQLQKGAGLRLLESIPSPHILVSFPVSSLGGRAKGMRRNYEEQFMQLIDGKDWQVDRFSFKTELAFLVKKQ